MKIDVVRTVKVELSNEDCAGLAADINYLLQAQRDSSRGVDLPYLFLLLRDLK